MSAPQTPSQTLGPYFSMILATAEDSGVMAGPDTAGVRIRITGRLLDGEGEAVEDGLVEIWQADADGHYRHPLDPDGWPGLHSAAGATSATVTSTTAPATTVTDTTVTDTTAPDTTAPDTDIDSGPDAFTGFGRSKTTFEGGWFSFDTIRPGPVAHPAGGLQAPHVNVVVQARGMLNPVWTRLYFAEDVTGAPDDLLRSDPVLSQVPPDRLHTLLAIAVDDPKGPPTYALDIRLQGPDETVILAW